jgi:ketosteroid isomerase-like protein
MVNNDRLICKRNWKYRLKTIIKRKGGDMTTEEIEKKYAALEKRVQAMEDIEEIKNLHTEYIYNLTNWEFDEMADKFSEDAVCQLGGTYKGKEEIKEKVFDKMKENPAQKGGHMLIQPMICVEGDKAKGQWTMYRFSYWFRGTGGGQQINLMDPSIQRRYQCEYKKENGKWKISDLKFGPWPDPDPRYSAGSQTNWPTASNHP